MYDYTQLINDVVAAGLAVSGIVGLARKGKLNFGVIKEVAKDVAVVAEDAVKIPAIAAVKTELEHKLSGVMDDLKKSELGRLAAEALNYTEKDLKDLSDDQKKALVFYVQSALANKYNVTKDEIEKALELAQQASDAIADSPLVKAADAFTAELQAPQTQQTPA
ncbi:hypothetical protein LSG31_00240 [Fodinisporobacter ferrooxydans]|uniref:Holin n=1 Tax=Fodinisporobacter ferrooxydans TaxID=2901836 RepID=A0ABY4CJP8_9BACL|nr:hypothetical protein LSG31_00240 [Alicyclobacillaceae bacterium MYW30-H2]